MIDLFNVDYSIIGRKIRNFEQSKKRKTFIFFLLKVILLNFNINYYLFIIVRKSQNKI